MVKIRPLTGKDTKQYDAFCEQARLYPGFFYEASGDEPLVAWLNGLAGDPNYLILGAFKAGDELAGVASVSRRTHPRWHHRASVHQIHAAPNSDDILAALLDAAVSLAKGMGGLRQLELDVILGDMQLLEGALRTGFEHWGSLPEGVQLDGRFYEQSLMILRLTGPRAGC